MTVESVYRAALRVYPASWRRENEEEALGVLLDVAEASGEARASLREASALVANGLRARLELALPARWRALAAASVMVGTTGFALVDLIFFEWQPWVPTVVYPHAGIIWALAPFSTPQVVPVIVWLIAAMMWVIGRRVAARVLFALTGASASVLAWLAMHPVRIRVDSPYFVVTPRHLLASFLAPQADHSVGATLTVLIVGTVVVLAGDADRALRPLRQLIGAVAAGLAILLLWAAQGKAVTLLFNAARRTDDDLWRGWVGIHRAAQVDAAAVIFLVVVALAIGLGQRAVAARLVAVLGPLTVVWSVYYLLFHRTMRFGHPWTLWGHLAFVIALPLAAGLLARLLRPLAIRRLVRA